MNLLLDSCALLALADGSLPPTASHALEIAPNAYVSVISPWELAIKAAKGRLTFAEPVHSWFMGLVERYDLLILPLDPLIACAAAELPPIHRDPYDRMLVAAAQQRNLTILTSDEIIPTYPRIQTLW